MTEDEDDEPEECCCRMDDCPICGVHCLECRGESQSYPGWDAAVAATDEHLRGCVKHPMAELTRERDDAKRVAESLAERVHKKSELLSRRAERVEPGCGSQE